MWEFLATAVLLFRLFHNVEFINNSFLMKINIKKSLTFFCQYRIYSIKRRPWINVALEIHDAAFICIIYKLSKSEFNIDL